MLYCLSHDLSYTYCYAVKNEAATNLLVTLDCSMSKNMHYSEPKGKVSRYVAPGDFVFLMNIEAADGFDEFVRGVEVTCDEHILK